jgi:hypothetical protein
MRTICKSNIRGLAVPLGMTVLALVSGPSAFAAGGWHAYNPLPAPRAPEADVRVGGVVDVSYNYHTQGPESGVVPPSPWYGWGFPVETYRWGWFGAEHYYPRVFWHHGYYGDCCRHGYRCGY